MRVARISTHLLDTVTGTPAAGVPVQLYAVDLVGERTELGAGVTDGDGRVADLLTGGSPVAGEQPPGDYQLVFRTLDYFTAVHGRCFYPRLTVEAHLDGARSHYHLPVLFSVHSYSTYLGS